VREELVPNAHDRGEHLRERLKDEIGEHPLVRAVRGRGLLVGIELGPARSGGLLARFLPSVVDGVSKRLFGQWLAVRLLDRGILCRPCSYQWNVLKLAPPLNVSEAEVERVVAAISEILGEYKELTPLLVDIGQKLGSQFLSAAKTWAG
jgi:4-aminobutyrate aminotransferase-like enzyme